MSGYDGPSIFRHQSKNKEETDQPVTIKKSNRTSFYQPKKEKKIEKPSLKNVALSRARVEKRTSTPFNPTKLPSREYFQRRYQEGTKEGVKEMYAWIRQQLKVADDDLILFENKMKDTQHLFENGEEKNSDSMVPRRGLNSDLDIDFNV